MKTSRSIKVKETIPSTSFSQEILIHSTVEDGKANRLLVSVAADRWIALDIDQVPKVITAMQSVLAEVSKVIEEESKQ